MDANNIGDFSVEPDRFDLRQLPAEFYRDPYPTYARIRGEAPVLALPDGGYFLSRHADLSAVYRDAHRFSSDKRVQFAPVFGEGSPLYEHHTTSLVFNDPPLHTHVRKAIGNALSNKMVQAMREGVEGLVDELIEALAAKGEADLIADFASAIPIEIIGNMLCVPREERRPLRRWSLAILGGLEVGLDDDGLRLGNDSVNEFLSFLEEFVPRRQREMIDSDDDILSRLLRWESDGFRLDAAELYHQCIFLLNAGHETTTNLIGNGIELLVRFPAAQAQLRADPSLLNSAVEEILRYESSNQLGNRTTTESIEIRGVPIAAGKVLTLCIGSANRDGEAFDVPEMFDITRSPNPHLAFGHGIHTCAGLNVARLEGRVAIGRLLQKFASFELTGEPTRAHRARFRGFEKLPVRLKAS